MNLSWTALPFTFFYSAVAANAEPLPLPPPNTVETVNLENVLLIKEEHKKLCVNVSDGDMVNMPALMDGLFASHKIGVSQLPLGLMTDRNDAQRLVLDPSGFYKSKTAAIIEERDRVRGLEAAAEGRPAPAPTNAEDYCRATIRGCSEAEIELQEELYEHVKRSIYSYLRSADPKSKYFRVTGSVELFEGMPQDVTPDERQQAYAEALLGDGKEIKITCVIQEDDKPNSTIADMTARFMARSKSSELSVAKKSSNFKKVTPASFSYTNNAEKGERTLDIRGVVGLETASKKAADYPSNFSRILFLGYTFSTTKTEDGEGDKDIRQLTPGLQFSRSLFARYDEDGFLLPGVTCNPLCLRASGEISHTFNMEENSKVLRGRLQFDVEGLGWRDQAGRVRSLFGGDTSVRLPVFGETTIRPTAGAFIEGGHVFAAGTSTDFATLEDDQYIGVGGVGGIYLSPDFGITEKDRLKFIATYRHMETVSGLLSDPSRFTAAIEYALTNHVAVTLSYEEGQHLETFQDEELTKIGLGIKY